MSNHLCSSLVPLYHLTCIFFSYELLNLLACFAFFLPYVPAIRAYLCTFTTNTFFISSASSFFLCVAMFTSSPLLSRTLLCYYSCYTVYCFSYLSQCYALHLRRIVPRICFDNFFLSQRSLSYFVIRSFLYFRMSLF